MPQFIKLIGLETFTHEPEQTGQIQHKYESMDVDKGSDMYNPHLRMLYVCLRRYISDVFFWGDFLRLFQDQNATIPEGSINKTAVI